MDWVEENSESSQKCVWAQRYYDALYYIMYSPGLIIGIILSTIRNDCDPVTAKNILILIIIGQIIGAFDRQLNFGSKSKEFANYSSIYQSFSDRILEELIKPEAIKQNGSVFYHDMNIEKQRINEKTSSIPFVIEKLYKYHKKTRSKMENSSISSDHIIIIPPETPKLVPVRNIVKKNSDPFDTTMVYTITRDIAARKIQNAWYNYCYRKGNFTSIKCMMNRRKKLYNFKDTVSTLIKKIKNYEDSSTHSTLTQDFIEVFNNVGRETNINKKQSIIGSPPALLKTSKTSCNLLIDNPQTKAQKKLAKMIHEQNNNDDNHQELHRAYQLERFNSNFNVNDNIIEIVENMRRRPQGDQGSTLDQVL
jgi:hypothetical protein